VTSRLPPPPARFTPAIDIRWADFSPSTPHFKAKRKPTGRRLQGIKYEAEVQQYLMRMFPHSYLPSPWLRFGSADGMKFCQADGLLVNLEAGILTIVEVKYQHTTDAWWQLRRLYQPVLAEMFPSTLWQIRVLEIVKWYDPHVEWPEPITKIADLHTAHLVEAGTTGIHIWKP